jgi:hypothetical protein
MISSFSPAKPTIDQLQELLLQIFDREISEKHLTYHNREHINGVVRRSNQIFNAIRPYLSAEKDPDHLEYLLNLCAVSHDLIQIFTPQLEPNIPRRRESGISEAATIEVIFSTIQKFNANSQDYIFTDMDLYLIREAILTTICDYNPAEESIFQPMLYQENPVISDIARTLALADLGTLGIEGIEAYNTEGRSLFLEENPDIQDLIENTKSTAQILKDPILSENIRQRLLRRARFQINLAKSRLKRFSKEISYFPIKSIPILTQEIFQHLTPETIQTLEKTTPIHEDTSLETLIYFFKLNVSIDQNL